ncbi:MAG: hypothetical protein KGR26_06285 [Cyanobacteria bacterium REEB65]|nr:hypothetical protein [Cyanobacteria bacterium REEB65]
MKLARLTAGIAAVGAVFATAGCPLLSKIPGLGPSPTPPAFSGFPSGTLLDGRFVFQGKAPTQLLKVDAKAGPSSPRLSTLGTNGMVTTDSNGYFSWSSLPGPASPSYQIIWDDQGSTQTSDQNTMGLWVSSSQNSPPSSVTSPQITQDLYWAAAPSPAPNGTLGSNGQITFTPATSLPADTQYTASIFFDTGNGQKVACSGANDVTGTSSPLTWDGKCYPTSNNGNVTAPPSGASLFYEIKFFANGGTFGGTTFYGSTKYIPFSM